MSTKYPKVKHPIQSKWLFAIILVIAVFPAVSHSQGSVTTRVDDPKTVYRSLARLTLDAFKKGDLATAAELATILDVTWTQSEHCGPDALSTKDGKLYEHVDDAMDYFIKPIMHYEERVPDKAKVEVNYDKYLEALKQAKY